jgi:hypothetical protein
MQHKVSEITLDMAANMSLITKNVLTQPVTDRSDAQKLALKNITRDKNQIPLTSY